MSLPEAFRFSPASLPLFAFDVACLQALRKAIGPWKIPPIVDPERYVEYVLKNLEPTPLSEIDRLLPWSEELPKELRGRKELPKDLEKAVKEAEKNEKR